jgi:hypothetical protein
MIEKKQFNRLTQASRIEYLIRKDRIERTTSHDVTAHYWAIGYFFGYLTLMLLFIAAFGMTYFVQHLARTFVLVAELLVWAVTVLVILDFGLVIIKSIRRKKEMKELDEFFFVVNPKIKK